MHTPDGFVPAQILPASLPETSLVFAFRGGKIAIEGSPDAPRIPSARSLVAAGLLSPASLAGSTGRVTPTGVGPFADIAAPPGVAASAGHTLSGEADAELHFLGELDGIACSALAVDDAFGDDTATAAGLQFVGLRGLFFRLPETMLALAGRASQVVEWDRTHRYCGRCGAPTRNRPSERAKECPTCGLVAYPRVSPAMMVLVTRGDELLLARAHHFVPGMYSALAGFVESGETIEDCIRREVREEVGIEVKDITYFASQSWPFPHSLMIAFNAEWASGDIVLGVEEMDDAKWFAVDALPDLPSPVSISRRLINATIARIRSRSTYHGRGSP